jgi:hypothetical protein
MSIRTRIVPVLPLLLGGLWLAPSVSGAETSPVQCAANDDRVWVYDSLTSFSVELRLKCGDQVEIISRVKGYVKIRTEGGKEGYVPDAALPNLPPYVDPQAMPVGGLASMVRPRTSAPVHPAAAPESPANASVKAASPEATAVMTIEPLPSSPSPTSASPSGAASPSVVSASAVAGPSAIAPRVKPVSVAPKKTVKPAIKKPAAPQLPPASSSTSSSASAASPATGKSSPQKPSENSNVQVVILSSGPSNTTPRIESAVEKSPMPIDASAGMKKSSAAPGIRSVADSSDSEDDPDVQPEDQSADPACHVFFSAYGLAPAQYRWIAQNRQKRFPGICPASSPSKVDFVILFTHDADVFSSALPDAIHVDKNGFSDFSPLTTVDTALLPEAEADKAHHQYVWVFQMKRGAFDPAKFSPRRHPQFTKYESNSLTASHATDRIAEDAFEFIEGLGVTR